jgi:hypothetical protein
MTRLIFSAALVLTLNSTALAENQFNQRQTAQALAALQAVGASCGSIRRTQTVGTLPNRDTIVAIECDTDARLIVRVPQRGDMTFYATCQQYEQANPGENCFP